MVISSCKGEASTHRYYVKKITVSEYIISPKISSVIDSWEWQLLMNEAFLNVLSYEDDYSAPFFTYPFANGSVNGSGEYGYNISILKLLSSAVVNGVSYYNVAEINNYSSTSGLPVHDDWFYVNADVGIVKMGINDLRGYGYPIWELERSHIVR